VNPEEIYNPLDKRHLADSIARAFFDRPVHPLPPQEIFRGAGIYAIYYKGTYPLYRRVAESFSKETRVKFESQPIPIYIGKSDAPGSRKGVPVSGNKLITSETQESAKPPDLKEAEEFLTKKPQHRKLYDRLVKHSKSIMATSNLQLGDFFCRYMLVDEIWVPLGEARLLELFQPLWNVLIEGFGSNPEGEGRTNTARPVWDILHPGRKEKLGVRVDKSIETPIVKSLRGALTPEQLREAIEEHRKARLAFNRSQKKNAEPVDEEVD